MHRKSSSLKCILPKTYNQMSYTSKTLLPGENVLYKGYVSAWYFAPALLLALIGAVVLIFALAPETGTLAYIH